MLPQFIGAQTLSGTVRSALAGNTLAGTTRASSAAPLVSGPPVAGALVELRDSSTAVIARQLTNAAGDFRFLLPRPGRYQLDVRRIGFVRQTLAPRMVDSDAVVDVPLSAVVVMLPAVTSRERSRCRNNVASGTATARLWQSAVTSLLSAAATVEDSTLLFDVMPSTRQYTLPDGYLVDVTLRDERVRDALPWSSLDPRDLAEFGYVRLVGRTLQYVAPDVDVLTSEAFLTSHCLQLRNDRSMEGLLGLAFAPTNEIRQADIRGVLWIDEATQELRRVDYTYASLPLALVDTIAGGRVELVSLGNAGVIPSRWSVRSPVPTNSFLDAVAYRGEDMHRAGFPVAVRELDPPLRSSQLQVTGSAVQRVRRVTGSDTVLVWSRAPSGVDVRVEWTQNAITMPAARARVALSGSSREGTTDLLGRVTFAELPDGEYFVEARTEVEELLGAAPSRQAITVEAGQTAMVRLPVSAPLQSVANACGEGVRGGVLAGRVERAGRPISGVAVSLWRFASEEYGWRRDTLLASGTTTASGRYVVCGVPRGVPLTLAAVAPDGQMQALSGALPSSREAPAEFVTRRDVRLGTGANRTHRRWRRSAREMTDAGRTLGTVMEPGR